MAGWVEGICIALVLGLVLIAGTAIEQAPSVDPLQSPYHHSHQTDPPIPVVLGFFR